MSKKLITTAILSVSVFFGTFLLFQLIFPFAMRLLFKAPVASIGIIGGADGPTSIFVARGNLSANHIVIALCGVIAVASGIICFRKKR